MKTSSVQLLACVLTTWLASSLSVAARVGETKDQIEKRYGQPTETLKRDPKEPQKETLRYSFQGYVVEVGYEAGVCVYESYQHEPSTEQKYSTDLLVKMSRDPLSAKEIQFFLEANAGGSTWRSARPYKPDWSAWERVDGKMEASFVPDADFAGGLTVRVKPEKAATKDDTKGF